jgi:hypothetical protein
MKRPKGVPVIAVYFMACATVLPPLILVLSRNEPDPLARPVLLFASTVLIVLSVGLWRMKNWARICTAILSIAGLISQAVSAFLWPVWDESTTTSTVFALWLAENLTMVAIHLSIAAYLLRSTVKQAFLARS